MKKNKSSKNWINKQNKDPYVRESKIQGYRSRSAFKLIEMNDKFKFLKKGTSLLDLGSSPGGWSQVASKNIYKGKILSVDIKQANVDYANEHTSERTNAYCMDSVEFLWDLDAKNKIDFLYLDSYDFEPTNPVPSQLHHIKELCAVMKNLKSGTLIVVDDHLNTPEFDAYRATLAQGGKARFVEDFMNSIHAECLHDGYQIVWRL